ncbi:MAG TPA: hypothetical protein VFT62_06015 [Mycobacteriales bacterium]|nr:hypothetical protein [Mycobacteriales bacterium]
MRVKRWASLALAGGTAAALVAVPTSAGAAGAQTLTVGVGGDSQISGIGFEGMRFDAPPLQVHKGDTITFEFRGFHTATLLPDDVSAGDWRAQHMAPGGDYALIQPDADDTPSAFEFNKTAILPSDPTCGAPTAACTYDGSSVVNSGLPIQAQSFTVTINDTAGKTFWVICLLHGMMQQRITVVPDGQPTTTQSAIDSYAKTTMARDRDEAAALIPKLEKRTSHTTSSGVKVWDAYGGFDGDGWGLDAMFPGTLRIHKGDRVRWHFAQLMGNIHTVTFPERAAGNFSNLDFAGQNIKCEADPTDTPPDAPPPTFCSTGIQNLEFELRAQAIVPVGSHRYAGKGLFSSGVKGAEVGNTTPWTLRFVHRSGKHGFHYACNVHGTMMSGRVIVS